MLSLGGEEETEWIPENPQHNSNAISVCYVRLRVFYIIQVKHFPHSPRLIWFTYVKTEFYINC